ncbi:MAG: transcription-repair coupling factor [Ignavibacteria bacterium]|nr:transcription-repair coupling factor [Ignavibacteria bacterium]
MYIEIRVDFFICFVELFDEVKNRIYKSDSFQNLLKLLSEYDTPPKNNKGKGIIVSNLNGSLVSFLLDFLYLNGYNKIFYIVQDNEKVTSIKDDITILDSKNFVAAYTPEKYYDAEDATKSLTLLSQDKNYIIISAVDRLSYNIIPKEKYRKSILHLKKGEEYLFEELLEKLEKYNYERKYFVEQPGDYAVRGGIVDVFAESFSFPVRLEFFGEMIESIREFDINTQRSIRQVDEILIPIVLSSYVEKEDIRKNNIIDYFSDDMLIFIDEECLSNSLLNNYLENSKQKKIIVEKFFSVESKINFKSAPQPDFRSNIKDLYNNLLTHLKNGYEIYIACSDRNQVKRMEELICEYEEEIESFERTVSEDTEQEFVIGKKTNTQKVTGMYGGKSTLISELKLLSESLSNGFVFHENKIILYTEHQIFNRYFRQYKKHHRYRSISIDELKQLKLGDYVVHRDFGIGIYSGLVTREIKGSKKKSYQDFVKLTYADGDVVYLSLNYINLISKYTSTEGYTPKITRIGGGDWERIKERTKKNVENIARDLILLYAKRKASKGVAFQPDTHWEKELEANFIYEDTPDQVKATAEVKADMQSESPMDRLICGDVGFGKTEVAVRASFKAVLGNKQVAVLVPTTILAVQHYHTFRDRLSQFAVEVESLTRFKSRKEQKEILQKLSEGKIDVIIGTHRLLSKDVMFKDLGLLIIDEEQRFGVKAKEKLRELKPNVDTLTLTATPIPRTLNFSLLGARDLSIINTPPKNRKPIITEIIKRDWDLISEIIKRELSRGGQVYFVNDKISGLYKIADKLKHLLPSARIGIAHGQMESGRISEINITVEYTEKFPELEKVIIDFIERKIDILVCTKIIESGLDIPNVNTILINNANTFGLAELYQLRGRVGRSSQQAYAYFITPPVSTLTKSALMRLQAIEEYTELGSGFNLSMRDIEIRGVGNLLGKEQSGFIQQIGFELYLDIINETVAQLKENEFSELFSDRKTKHLEIEKSKSEKSEKEIANYSNANTEKFTLHSTSIPNFIFEHDVNAFIPKYYIEDENERINMYKKLYAANESVELFTKELRDRFGTLPSEVENLLKLVYIRNQAMSLGIIKLTYFDNILEVYFPLDKDHQFYNSDLFTNLIQNISRDSSNKYSFVQTEQELKLKVFDVEFPFDLFKILFAD